MSSHLFAEQQLTLVFMKARSSSYLWQLSSTWVIWRQSYIFISTR